MSSVRMCDKCTRVFSENEEGWDSFTGSKRIRNEYGQPQSVQVSMDMCGECSVMTVPNTPQLTAKQEVLKSLRDQGRHAGE